MAEEADESRSVRRGRPAVLSIAVMAVSVYLLWALREETRYFFEPRVPADLGMATSSTPLAHNRHARVQGIPDRTRTVLIEGRLGHYKAVFRLHGTQSRLLVAQPRKHRMPPETYSDVFEGRLLRLADQAYYPKLYAYLADHMRTPVDLPVAELVRVAGTAPADVRGGDGVPFRLKPEDEVFFSVSFPGEYRVQFDRTRYPDAAESDAVVASLGLPWGPLEDGRAFRSYVVHADEAAASRLMEQFSDPVRKIGVLPRTAAIRCRWADVRAEAGGLVLASVAGPAPSAFTATTDGHLVAQAPRPTLRVPPDRVRSAEAQVPLRIPAGAMILHEGDPPGVYWYVVATDVVLLGLLALNAALLLRRRRPVAAGHAGGIG